MILDAELEPLEYLIDATPYFERLRHLHAPVWLDSCAASDNSGRYDILSAAPLETLRLDRFDPEQIAALQSGLSPLQDQIESPFSGGCIGYICYEANHGQHGLASPGAPLTPLVNLGLYAWALIQDHQQQRSWLIFHPDCPGKLRVQVKKLLAGAPRTRQAFRLVENFRATTSKQSFIEDIRRIQDYITAGDCYQVNYAQHFCAPYEGDEFTAYLALRQLSPTPLAAYLEFDDGAVLSLSPERFVQLEGSEVRTYPIKGTTPRHKDAALDRANRDRLRDSLKDRAENLMIVDLMRNDLSRVCIPGSVETPKLFDLQSFPTVHHLVSEVKGRLSPDSSALDLLLHTLPGGSISGAPKRRALEIIQELEQQQRNLYCGSILYWSRCGRMDSSITIRSLVATSGQLHCWGGGGITADSDPAQEWQETLDKVQPLMQRLETAAES